MQPESTAPKTCKVCDVSKPPGQFYRCRGYPDGRSRTCIECERQYKRRPDVMARARETAAASQGRKQARSYGVPATLTREEWDHARSFFGGCAYCGSTEGTMHMDHFIPESRGGAFTADNVVPSCASCNYRKHQRIPEVWCDPATYARVMAYFAGLGVTPNGGRPLRSPGYATGELHGSKTHPERLERGIARYNAKLTEDDVRAIRASYAAGEADLYQLADRFGVSQAITWGIVHRKRWSHVE